LYLEEEAPSSKKDSGSLGEKFETVNTLDLNVQIVRQEVGEWDRSQIKKSKEAIERRCHPCKLDKDGPPAAYLERLLRRAVAGAVEHAKIGAPRTHGHAVLMGHDP